MVRGFLNVPMVVWGVLALGVAGVFAVVIYPSPEVVNALDGPTFIIMRWFHSLVWVLLAASFFLRATGNPSFHGIANLLAAGGGITYAIYLFTVVRTGG